MEDSETEQRRQRMQARMQAPFEAPFNPGSVPSPEHRVANALEYIAYQMGQINQTLYEIHQAQKRGG